VIGEIQYGFFIGRTREKSERSDTIITHQRVRLLTVTKKNDRSRGRHTDFLSGQNGVRFTVSFQLHQHQIRPQPLRAGNRLFARVYRGNHRIITPGKQAFQTSHLKQIAPGDQYLCFI